MKKTIKNVGLDVHKNSISIGIAEDGRDGEVRYYGRIDNDLNQLDKVIRKLISQDRALPPTERRVQSGLFALLEHILSGSGCAGTCASASSHALSGRSAFFFSCSRHETGRGDRYTRQQVLFICIYTYLHTYLCL